MKKLLLYCFIAALAAPAMAEDWSDVPPGKGRIIIYGDFMALDLNDAQVSVDDEKAFPVKMTKNNILLDLPPGRHYVKISYPLIIGKPMVANVGLFLGEGSVGYLQYYVDGSGGWIRLVLPAKFQGKAKGRPAMRDPYVGGQQ